MAKIKNKLSYLLALVAPFFTLNLLADEPSSASSEEEAKEKAKKAVDFD